MKPIDFQYLNLPLVRILKLRDMTLKTLLILFAVLLFQNCTIGTSGIWQDDHIDKDKRTQINTLNDKLLKGIITNDTNNVKALFSDLLINKGGDFNGFINKLHDVIKTDGYRIFHEYDVRVVTTGNVTSIPSGFSDDNDFSISFQPANKESYVSLLFPKELENDISLLIIYGKYGKDWKINILNFGQYSLLGKNAIDYYKLAKVKYDKSYLIDAVNNIQLAQKLLQPNNQFFQYLKNKEINEFYEKVLKEANSKFPLPMTFDNIPTKPKLFKIYPEIVQGAFYPMVCYVSSINIKDTITLKKENEQVKKEVSRIFTGIDQDKQFVLYKAWKDYPNESTPVEYFGFVDKKW